MKIHWTRIHEYYYEATISDVVVGYCSYYKPIFGAGYWKARSGFAIQGRGDKVRYGDDYPTLAEAQSKVEELFGQVVALYNEG